MAPSTNILLLASFLLTSLTLTFAAPAPAPPPASLQPCYEIVITTGTLPLPLPHPTNTNSLIPQTASPLITSRISIVTPAPELRHRQWSVNTLPTETETDYYWDGEEPYSWPADEYPPWLPPNGGTIVNTGRLTVTLGKRDEGGEEKRQLSPITYGPGGWGNSVLPVTTEPSWWGEGKTFTFAGQTFTLGGTGVLTITLGKPEPRGVGVRTAMAGEVEGRQELSYEGGSTRDGSGGESGTVTNRPVVTFTDMGGEVRTVTVGGSDSLGFTQTPP
ncbi:hypothetical protein BKA65DRAFT_597300 [Rhexocercosporidium sp. MPI-PUGE-AT-0058]|nr:hypothetical protein BKA65DRAFT_597300 [Rhexocercosporidium sp. MPI-PUGE-AT-0058]